MNKFNLAVALGIFGGALALVTGVAAWGPAVADDEHERDGREWRANDHDEDGYRGWRLGQLRPEVPPASNPLYVEECGACHLAYPPAMLPARSWQRIMGSLDDHFGENAELDPATTAELSDYLVSAAAGADGAWIARKLQRGMDAGNPPLRITELPYFKHEHDEVPARLVRDNPKVGSFSRCEACHQDAERGMFDEHKVSIAGYGRWDD